MHAVFFLFFLRMILSLSLACLYQSPFPTSFPSRLVSKLYKHKYRPSSLSISCISLFCNPQLWQHFFELKHLMATSLCCCGVGFFLFVCFLTITVTIINSRQQRIPLLLPMYHISFSALLNPHPLPVVTQSLRGCSGALVSLCSLMGAGSANLHCAGWGSICKGLLGLLPDFFLNVAQKPNNIT